MKRVIVHFILILVSSLCHGEGPDLFLNPQDVPIFYDKHPLCKMESFIIITSIPCKNEPLLNKINRLIEKTVAQCGEVVHLKENDMRGFGTGNILLIQMGTVKEWNGNELPISRLSLSIETAVKLDKTGVKTFPIIWSINSFVDKMPDSVSESSLMDAMQKLVEDFIQSYEYANPHQKKKPLFYTYN